MRYKVALKKLFKTVVIWKLHTEKKLVWWGIFLFQAYKDRKELKTTYIFYSWSFKSRFFKEDFCCFSPSVLWDFFFFSHQTIQSSRIPLISIYRAAWSWCRIPRFLHETSKCPQVLALLFIFHLTRPGAALQLSCKPGAWIPMLGIADSSIKMGRASLEQLQQLGNHSIKSCSWCYKTTGFDSAEGNNNTEH